MTRNHLLHILKQQGIINDDNTLHIKFKKKLMEAPELAQLVVDHTSFLRGNKNCLKTRLHVLKLGITTQPVCETCGVDVHMRLDGKYRYTFPVFCSSGCFSSNDDVKKKRKITNIQKYGVENAGAAAENIEKRKQTCIKRYGVNNPMANDEIRAKQKQTNLERYGVENAACAPEIIQRREDTNLDRYGVRNAGCADVFIEKRKQTCIKRYGVDNPFKLPEVQEKADATMLERYGVSVPLQSKEIRDKFTSTMVTRYGYEHALQYRMFVTKMHQTMMDKYGIASVFELESVQKQIKDTMLAKYGVEYATQKHYTDEVLECLNDPAWLHTQHTELEKSLTKIAEELGIAQSTVGLYFKKYNVDVLSHSSSQGERDIAAYIRSIYSGTVLTNVRDVIRPLELDVYLPDLKIAFEYNGIFWHGEKQGKDRTYHLNKLQRCAEEGIRLIQITDAEWLTKQEIVQSRISSIVHNNSTIYARKTTIRQLSARESSVFFRETHIQGTAGQAICYGLVYEGEIVAAMSFGKARYTNGVDWELIRYANKLYTSVVGGASKLFSHFIKTHDAKSIVTYSDKRWNTGRLYKNLGFTFVHAAAPNYYYFRPIDTTKLYHRSQFQKHKLANKLEMFDPILTEWENMKLNGYDRIWDCGNDVYVYDAKSNI